VAQLPWGHVRVLLDKLSTCQERDCYAAAAGETTPAAASTPKVRYVDHFTLNGKTFTFDIGGCEEPQR